MIRAIPATPTMGTPTMPPRDQPLSAYRFMWQIVMFDLPVGTKAERRAATKFREWLLDQGYEMSQLSIYMRFCVGREQADRRLRDIAAAVPERGNVHVLTVTDRQFERMATFKGRDRRGGRKAPNQLELF
jgi:CRISPR-associated protein Cas2